MEENDRDFMDSTRRTALYLWIGLSLSLTLFFVQSQMFFVKAKPLPSSQLEWIFSGLGILTFLFGFFFFKNYTALRREKIKRMPPAERKQSLLVAFVLQYIIFETLGLYGVLISVLTQNTLKALPFIVFAYIGFLISFPRRDKIGSFFKN